MSTRLAAPRRDADRPTSVRSLPWPVWVAAGVALVLRLAWGLWVDHPPQGLFDPSRYVGYGTVIADGKGMVEPLTGGFPTAYYPPGYPWFVGIVAWLGRPFTDNVTTAVAVAQAGLGAATSIAGAVVGRALGGRRVAVVAAVGLALYPNLIYHSGAVLGETLYDFLFVTFAALVMTVRWPEGLGTRRVAAAGVALGLAVMVRPISLAILPVVAAVWWFAAHDWRKAVRPVLVLTLAVVACIVPWTIRNAIRMDAFIPISTNTGENLCIGHGPGATGSFTPRQACRTERTALEGPAGEVAADREKVRAGIQGVLDAPGREPWLLWRRFWYTWIRDGDHDGAIAVQSYRTDRFLAIPTERRLIRVADVAYWLVCATGVTGAVVLVRRRRPKGLFMVGAAIMTAAVPLAFFGDSRFKVPVIPLLIIMASVLAAGRSGPSAPRVDGAAETAR